jgi:hypothetical protein
MIQGRFGNTTGRPYIEGRIVFPRLGIVGNISFLADTGADRTAIMPTDSLRLGVNYAALQNPYVGYGVGGPAASHLENAILVFLESGVRLCVYQFDVLIQQPVAAIMTFPTLLGREVMQNWIFVYDKPHDRLTADVVHVHYDFPLPPHVMALPPVPGVAPPPILP